MTGGITGSGNLLLNSTAAGILTLSGTSVNNTGTITNAGIGTAANVISAVIGANVTGITENSATSALTLSGANTYSGGTTLTGGTLDLDSASALGTGTLLLNGGTINNSSAGAITLTANNAQAWNGDFTFTGTQALNLGTGNVTLGANRLITTTASTARPSAASSPAPASPSPRPAPAS